MKHKTTIRSKCENKSKKENNSRGTHGRNTQTCREVLKDVPSVGYRVQGAGYTKCTYLLCMCILISRLGFLS